MGVPFASDKCLSLQAQPQSGGKGLASETEGSLSNNVALRPAAFHSGD